MKSIRSDGQIVNDDFGQPLEPVLKWASQNAVGRLAQIVCSDKIRVTLREVGGSSPLAPTKAVLAASASDRELYQRQIGATDREIDRLVYELYGLTEEEVKIVEGS